MKIMIEFYRTREVDDAHAVVGRETGEAVDLNEAIEMAWLLVRTLDMPQRPDAMRIADEDGTTLHSCAIEPEAFSEQGPRS